MAITSYSELKSAITDWTKRSDLTSRLSDFITLAEARLNDMLLLKDSESEETLTLTTDQNYVALPAGYISPIALWLIVDSERVLLQMVLPEQLPYHTDSTQPQFWAVDGENIRFDCPADEGYSAKFRMVKVSNLSDSNTSNYLLERRPDIYLAACMVEASRYTRNTKSLIEWEESFTRAVNSMKSAENRAREVLLRTEIPARGRSNILRGD
jgi:hypothetical protein